MFVSMSNAHAKKVSFLALGLTFSFCTQTRLCYPAYAQPFIAAKHLQTPMDAKLEPNDVDGNTKVSKESKESTETASKEFASKESASVSSKSFSNLAPIRLTKDKPSGDKSDSRGSSKNQYMRLHAETIGISPKGPLDVDESGKEHTTLPSNSLKVEIGNRKDGMLDQARRVNVMPMVLMDTDAEAAGKALTDYDCEKAQISDLWEATLSRNQDILFVVQKLMPSSDRSHTTNVLMRMISSMIVSGVNTGGVVFGSNPGTVMGSQITSSMIYQMMGWKESKANKHAQIDQGQAIMLYQMVRNTAEKVTETYRDYKFHARRIDTAQVRALKLQNMIQDARFGQDAAKQIEMEYWGDRANADIEEAVYMARRYRHSLVDLAGAEAVCKLDQSFQDQFLAEKEIEGKRKSEVTETSKSKIPDPTKAVLTKLLNAAQPQ